MRKFLKNPGASDFLIDDMGQALPPGDELEILQHQLHAYLNSEDLIQAIRNGDILAGDGWTYYTNPVEGELYFRTRFDDDTYIVDGTSVTQITPAVVQDQTTGKKGTTLYMNLIGIMRELYNAPENPIYDPDFQKFIGPGGREVEHLARTLNLEEIHDKTGFHWIELHKGGYYKPFDLLTYYGWLNSFNYSDNSWNNESVAKDMARYNLIIFGDGIQDPGHGDYSNTEIIIPRVKALNPCALIFGYVTANQSQANFETKVDQWNDLEVHGIFMDECGYDYGIDRSEFNTLVDYIHSQTSANLVMTNAWTTDHIIGTANDPSYPNSTYNPGLVESHLTADDWIHLESFPINTTEYSGNNGYESRTEWASRGVKAIGHRDTYGINLVAGGIINNDNSNGQDLFDFGFISACMFALDGYGTSDTGYGASSATVEFWNRPDVKGAGRVWAPAPSVQNDISDNQIYWRYTDFAKFMLDFSSGAEDSSITIFGQVTATAPPGSGPTMKTGTTTTNNQGDGSVTFNTAFPDMNYSIVMSAQYPNDVAVCMWQNKTAGGFDIRTENDQGNNEPNVTVDWAATAHYDP